MNTIRVSKHKLNRMLANILSIFVVLAMAFPVSSVVHAASSPFVGHWTAIDVDGSDIRLTIAGRADGPFQITWTENYLSFCNGEAGIVRGTGWLMEGNSKALEADLHVECFTSDAEMDLHMIWRYHALTNTLSSRYDNGVVTIWKRPGGGNQPLPPEFNLRVMYGDDWVESFYEGGHTVWLTVTEADGVTVKATAEVTTGPREEWGGETGFQTRAEDWLPAQPDIQPNDWIFGWVDNGASTQVQIGEIRGAIHIVDDFIDGTIYAPWFTDPVQVECLDWGSGQQPPFDNYDAGFKLSNGEDPYTCSWEQWDIQPYQNIGVGYLGLDGNWVATYFYALNPRIVASETGNWFWVTDFNVGTLDLFLYDSADEDAALLWSGNVDVTEAQGITMVGSDIHRQDFLPGNYLVVSDGVNSKGLVLETITIDVFDTETEFMSGTATPGRDVWAAAGPQEWQERILAPADPETGAWSADFTTIEFDITEDMRPWSYASVYDEDGDSNEGSTPAPSNTRFTVWPEQNYLEGYEWPDGALVSISVVGKDACTTEAHAGFPEWDPSKTFFSVNFPDGCAIEAWDVITLESESQRLTHQVPELSVNDVNTDFDQVTGSAIFNPEQYLLHIWINDVDGAYMQLSVEGENWVAAFGSHGIELLPGMSGRVELVDQSSNATTVEWSVP